jgi:hypothetical protein
MHHHDAGHDNNAGDRHDVAEEIEAELVVKRGIGGVGRRSQKKRVAIRRRAYDRLSADIAVRTGPDLISQPIRLQGLVPSSVVTRCFDRLGSRTVALRALCRPQAQAA